MNGAKWVWVASLFFGLGQAPGEEIKNARELAVIEIGAAPSWNLKDHTSSLGPTVAVEVSPVENWLELEAGVAPSFSHGETEWATDLLFKKPWTLSRTLEFMAGIGPEWIHSRNGGVITNSLAGEAALDFMFWPTRWKRRFGWYVEPAYEYSFGPRHEQSIGISFGPLIAIGKH